MKEATNPEQFDENMKKAEACFRSLVAAEASGVWENIQEREKEWKYLLSFLTRGVRNEELTPLLSDEQIKRYAELFKAVMALKGANAFIDVPTLCHYAVDLCLFNGEKAEDYPPPILLERAGITNQVSAEADKTARFVESRSMLRDIDSFERLIKDDFPAYVPKADVMLLHGDLQEVERLWTEKGYRVSDIRLPLELNKPEYFELIKKQGVDLKTATAPFPDGNSNGFGIGGERQASLLTGARSREMVEYLVGEGVDPSKADMALAFALGKLGHDEIKNGKISSWSGETTEAVRERQNRLVDTIEALLHAGVPQKVDIRHSKCHHWSNCYSQNNTAIYERNNGQLDYSANPVLARKGYDEIRRLTDNSDLLADIANEAEPVKTMMEKTLFPEVQQRLVTVVKEAKERGAGRPKFLKSLITRSTDGATTLQPETIAADVQKILDDTRGADVVKELTNYITTLVNDLARGASRERK